MTNEEDDIHPNEGFSQNIMNVLFNRMIIWNISEKNKHINPVYMYMGLSAVEYYDFSQNPYKWVNDNITSKIDASTAVKRGFIWKPGNSLEMNII